MAGIWRRWIGAAGLALAGAIFLALPALAEGAGGDQLPTFWDRFNVLIGIVLVGAFTTWYLYHARRGRELYIRPIAGLQAMDEAVGRATEMGKPVLFVPGIKEMGDIQTLAGLSILGYVAQKTAEYETPILVPTCTSLVMSSAQEVVREAYLKQGRLDVYNPDSVRYLTDDQFGYVAGIDGIMLRDRPAANFYMGSFFAESLILAETGHSVGAIQIAGTANVHQLPFFVAACDYTLIGEEIYAASAYLSKDSHQVSSIKGQDVAKAFSLGAIVVGAVCASILALQPEGAAWPWLKAFIAWFEIK